MTKTQKAEGIVERVTKETRFRGGHTHKLGGKCKDGIRSRSYTSGGDIASGRGDRGTEKEGTENQNRC